MKFSVTALAFLSCLALCGCVKRLDEAGAPVRTESIMSSDAGGSASRPDGGHLTGLQANLQHPRSRAAHKDLACVDAWLAAHGLDAYGSPNGTLYMGGTPLFDEATGETRDRLDYLLEHEPRLHPICETP